MSEFFAFFQLGLGHLVGIGAIGHILLLAVLAVAYRARDRRDALPVISAQRSRLARRPATWTCSAMLAVLVLLAPAARAGLAHPLHTTLTRLSYDDATRVLTVSVRVFADDFDAAMEGRAGSSDAVTPSDSAMARYLVERFGLVGGRGTPIHLRWCGMRRAGEALFFCLRAGDQPSPSGARMRNVLLTEIFGDQVNVVQASYGGVSRTMMFTPRDSVRVLP